MIIKKLKKRRKQSTPAVLNEAPPELKDKRTMKEKFSNVDSIACINLYHILGIKLEDISSWKNVVQLLYKPMDPACLGVVRALFGFLMVLDIPEERGLADIDVKWGDPTYCHFPLFNFLTPLSLPWMGIIYLIMWLGAIGIMLGFMYRLSCLAFIIPYWYIFLLDKSVWNNHSYLYGVTGILLLGTNANHFWSLDGYLGRVKTNTHVPLWNYAILRFQFFVLYFFAGLKKIDKDWLGGYSMTHLNQHWIFEPFKFILTPEQVDYYIVHLSGFMLDLTIGFWLLIDKTRPYAFIFCSTFHVMNSHLFTIGMFPYVCLATLPLFSHVDWPRQMGRKFCKTNGRTVLHKNKNCIYSTLDSPHVGKNSKKKSTSKNASQITWKHHFVVSLLLCHVGLQVFLPYSHFITKGYNNWTNGLYGYSWDMMVHSWDTVLVIVKVVDNATGKEHFLDSEAWVHNDRWTKHADMLVQYGQCLRRNLLEERKRNEKINDYISSNNISIYIDVWSSLNGRFQQRMFDPTVDILTTEWSPFKKTSWLMPLLTEFSSWRQTMEMIETEIYTWNNYSDVLFVADFPGLHFENYINRELTNVTFTVLEGEVIVQDETDTGKKKNYTLSIGKSLHIPEGRFHSIHTISQQPSCFMYTYMNHSKLSTAESPKHHKSLFLDGVINAMKVHVDNIMRAITLVSNSFLNIVYSVPMVKRVRVG